MREPTLKDFGYPEEGIIDVAPNNGPDSYERPQEGWSPHTCASCRKLNADWECTLTGEEKDPDEDTCDQLDYKKKWLEEYRDPVRCEYSSDRTYKQACEAIKEIRDWIERREEDAWH